MLAAHAQPQLGLEYSAFPDYADTNMGRTEHKKARQAVGAWSMALVLLTSMIIVLQSVFLWRAQSATLQATAALQARALPPDLDDGVDESQHRVTYRQSMTTKNLQRAASRPQKFLLDGITPSVDQGMRGDCWLFAITGVLEDSYRRFGLANGWLKQDEYLQLSRQALGISVMETCRANPSSMCPADADGDGKIWWGNTTEGADERMLFFFHSLGSGAMPDAVCDYTRTPTGQKDCPGLEAAKASNPLLFNVTGADSYYESLDIKDALLEKRHALTIGLQMNWNEVYLPCTEQTSALYAGCAAAGKPGECLPCPPTREYGGTRCCTAERRPMVTMRGEWYSTAHGKKIELGGHAINIVGFTDTYLDEHGNQGGFILRNSWSDGLGFAHASKGRGSHSYLYYMRGVSDWDEARVCPNPHSPRSWAHCDSLTKCKNAYSVDAASSMRKPMRLSCIDNGGYLVPGLCERGAIYFMRNLTEWDSGADRAGLFIGCFLRADDGAQLCAPPLMLDDLATLFTPEGIDEGKIALNRPEVCGFNFLPYRLVDELQSRWGFLTASSFNIEWSRFSYISQRDAPGAEGLDYRLLERSMKTMPIVERQAGPLWV